MGVIWGLHRVSRGLLGIGKIGRMKNYCEGSEPEMGTPTA